MIQIGNTSVWLTDGIVKCESYTGDLSGNRSVKQKIVAVSEESANRFLLQTNKGKGHIHFNESSTGNYTVELVLSKFIGRHRFYGAASSSQVHSFVNQLKSL